MKCTCAQFAMGQVGLGVVFIIRTLDGEQQKHMQSHIHPVKHVGVLGSLSRRGQND